MKNLLLLLLLAISIAPAWCQYTYVSSFEQQLFIKPNGESTLNNKISLNILLNEMNKKALSEEDKQQLIKYQSDIMPLTKSFRDTFNYVLNKEIGSLVNYINVEAIDSVTLSLEIIASHPLVLNEALKKIKILELKDSDNKLKQKLSNLDKALENAPIKLTFNTDFSSMNSSELKNFSNVLKAMLIGTNMSIEKKYKSEYRIHIEPLKMYSSKSFQHMALYSYKLSSKDITACNQAEKINNKNIMVCLYNEKQLINMNSVYLINDFKLDPIQVNLKKLLN